MKKRRYSFLLPFLGALLLTAGCGSGGVTGTDASLLAIRDELLALTTVEDPTLLSLNTASYLEMLYGIQDYDCEEAAVSVASTGTFSEEIILVKAVDEESAGDLKSALEEHLEAVLSQARDYAPEGYEIARQCEVKTDGLYVWLFVSENAEEMEKVFAAHRRPYKPEEVPVYPEPTATPTPAPTPSPTPSPVPESTPEPSPEPLAYGLVPERARVEDSWWDDVLFIGNSVGRNIEQYVTKQRLGGWPTCMGRATLWTGYKFAAKDCARFEGVLSPFKGRNLRLADVIREVRPKKVFVMMAHVDLVFRQTPIEETLGYIDEICDIIKDTDPDIELYVCSMSPRIQFFEKSALNSAAIRRFNQLLLDRIQERKDCYLVDIFTPLADENGCLKPEYSLESNEGGIHLTAEGCAAFVEYLYCHTVSG